MHMIPLISPCSSHSIVKCKILYLKKGKLHLLLVVVQKSGVHQLRSVEVGSLFHYLQGFLAPSKRWLALGFNFTINHIKPCWVPKIPLRHPSVRTPLAWKGFDPFRKAMASLERSTGVRASWTIAAWRNLGGGNSNNFYFHPIWGRIPFWLIFFQMGWNHQLEIVGFLDPFGPND